MRTQLRYHVTSILNLFPEVTWDRFTHSPLGLEFFGWIERDDNYKDFMIVLFVEGRFNSISTSSAKYSKDFSIRANCEHHDCQRVEDVFAEVKCIKLNKGKHGRS